MHLQSARHSEKDFAHKIFHNTKQYISLHYKPKLNNEPRLSPQFTKLRGFCMLKDKSRKYTNQVYKY